MKRILIVLLTVSLLAISTACSSGGGNTGSSSASEESSQTEPEITDVSLDDIFAEIEAAYGDDYPGNGTIPPEVLETEFGLTADLYEEVRADMAMISVHNDRIVVAKAKEGKADELEQVLLDARTRKIEDSLQYPQNIAKTNAAQVVRNGDYVAFLLVGVPNDDITDEAQAKEYAQSEVQKAVDAFNRVFEG